ncbi:hypothetical protein GCM10011316_29320 [Roseibium aquae]|uniref:Uracil DNA glycosylase superfamily protein n=1 Tax=Roseibium aquae TaxID=1323746 RepID=A0A916TMA1_9HYPH|nr:hypothetical protein [Roseibium aquae]GGB55397.1 hypothetical protein GCM10011316_29320 [Roseibium aquae]
MENHSIFADKFLPIAQTITADRLVQSPEMSIASEGAIRVQYAPFDYIEKEAKLVVVGITPGETQATNAWQAVLKSLNKGLKQDQALADAKLIGSFSGAMRSNLVAMLDAIGVGELLGCNTTASLFEPGSREVHFTSALRYPVFVNRKNYNGTPEMLKTPLLRRFVETCLAEEARTLPSALWLPLGPKASAALEHLSVVGCLDPRRVLVGLPHPSGANAERVAVFLGRKSAEKASRKTNPAALQESFARLRNQVTSLSEARA